MKIALEAAKFSSEEANQLRKAMATFRSRGNIELLQDKMVGRMVERGYDPDFAQRCFDQIKGFGEYGFPESHAASFAHLVYVSSWLKWKYPAAFACALLNSQPMGFYAPAQIVRDAREHGVEVRAVDVNHSDWDCTLEDGALRLGLRQVEGFHREAGDRLVARRTRPYRIGRGIARRAGGVPVHAIERLAEADAFRSIGLDRRAALWDSRALKPALGPALVRRRRRPRRGRGSGDGAAARHAAQRACGQRLPDDAAVAEGAPDALPARALCRAGLHHRRPAEGTSATASASSLAGLVLIRQRPGSAKGVCFITLEDETGIANLVVWPDVFEAQRRIVMGARLMVVHGIIQRDEDIIHVVAASWRTARRCSAI